MDRKFKAPTTQLAPPSEVATPDICIARAYVPGENPDWIQITVCYFGENCGVGPEGKEEAVKFADNGFAEFSDDEGPYSWCVVAAWHPNGAIATKTVRNIAAAWDHRLRELYFERSR